MNSGVNGTMWNKTFWSDNWHAMCTPRCFISEATISIALLHFQFHGLGSAGRNKIFGSMAPVNDDGTVKIVSTPLYQLSCRRTKWSGWPRVDSRRTPPKYPILEQAIFSAIFGYRNDPKMNNSYDHWWNNFFPGVSLILMWDTPENWPFYPIIVSSSQNTWMKFCPNIPNGLTN